MDSQTRQTDKPSGVKGWLFLLLILIGLAVVAALLVGSSWPPHEQGRKSETSARQKRLAATVKAYRKVTGADPNVPFDPASPDPDKRVSERQIAILLARLQGAGPTDPVHRATAPFLGQTGGQDLTVDGYGNAMVYLKDGGFGGQPCIVSAGPDGKFGWEQGLTAEQRKRYGADNIRSDQ